MAAKFKMATKAQSNFGDHLELSGHFEIRSFQTFFKFFSSPKSIIKHNCIGQKSSGERDNISHHSKLFGPNIFNLYFLYKKVR
jgi:hypothetical protein